jgi:hypothetical protein
MIVVILGVAFTADSSSQEDSVLHNGGLYVLLFAMMKQQHVLNSLYPSFSAQGPLLQRALVHHACL